MKLTKTALLLLPFALSSGNPVYAAETHEVIFERDVEATMRDGIVLNADIYRPKDPGKYPVLLERTPYDKQDERDIGIAFASYGYVVIMQDVRGRWSSPGEWYPFKNEINDGYDTVEWAASLPYSNGKVGMFGGSYEAATQVLAAIAHPPHLAGLFSVDTASDYHDGWVYQGGAFEQWMSESWTASLARDTINRRARAGGSALAWADKLPISSFPVLNPISQENLAPYFFDWLAHPNYDEFWKEISIEEHVGDITVPALHVGAWYDIFLRGTLRNYLGFKSSANGETARRHQRLIIVVGGHAGGGRKIGEVDFGANLESHSEDQVMRRWYDYLLKGISNGLDQEKAVKIFVMGKNEWRDEDDWPLERARNTPYYLQSAGKANSLRGEGTLAPQSGRSSSSDKFTYDPANPVRTHGGPLCCTRSQLAPGPLDQRSVENRDDVLIYTTPAFQQDFEVTGPVSLDLYVSSSAVDTDFTAKLVDVWPSGFAQNLTEGILRMCYRDSQSKPELLNPGQIYKIKIDMIATSNVFLAGHKLRLEISSSNFPRFDRNLNSGEAQAHATRIINAENIIYHDKEHPSALVLPVVPR